MVNTTLFIVTILIVINKMINKLEVAYETDKKGRKNKNDERRRTVKKDR